VDPEALLAFLSEHEPALARRLKKLRQENPERFTRTLPLLGRVYAPVMDQMKQDPQLGELALKRVRLEYQIRQARQAYGRADEASTEQQAAQQKLRDTVAEMFDVILEQEKLRLEWAQARLGDWTDRVEERRDIRARAYGERPRREGPPPEGRFREIRSRLQEHQQTLETWQQNREKIVAARVEELLQDRKPFPWGP
jgi:hypothetical protein